MGGVDLEMMLRLSYTECTPDYFPAPAGLEIMAVHAHTHRLIHFLAAAFAAIVHRGDYFFDGTPWN